jgi:tRNA(Leu) C34 or U34 (ribose-2'-O)-methylase TrmL
MHGMLAIEPAEMQQAQKELMKSCLNATEGIKIMFKEDKEQEMSEMQNERQLLAVAMATPIPATPAASSCCYL